MENSQKITNAFFDAQRRRPYKRDPGLVRAAIPSGGNWICRLQTNGDGYEIIWGGVTVATVNPKGDLDDITEAQIAMAMRALPAMDAALRAIIVLAENSDNANLIRDLAVACVEFIEQAAPELEIGDGADSEDDEPQDVGLCV